METQMQIQISMDDNNQIRKFQCNKCNKSKLVLKKVADKQHHGFACDECWATIDKKSRYNGCLVA
jgi:transcription elongation factor Elf1